MKSYNVELTDTEWMELIDGSDNRDNNLGMCCANISALRDSIFSIARCGNGEVFEFEKKDIEQKVSWCLSGHDLNGITALVKLCQQLEINLDNTKHIKDTYEC